MKHDVDPATPEQAAAIRRAFELGFTNKLEEAPTADPLLPIAAAPRRTGWMLAAAVIAATAVIMGGASILGRSRQPVRPPAAASQSSSQQSSAPASSSQQSAAPTSTSLSRSAAQFPQEFDLPWTDVKPLEPGVVPSMDTPQPVTVVGSASKKCVYVISHNGQVYNLVFPKGYTARFTSETEFAVITNNRQRDFKSDTHGLKFAGIIPEDQIGSYDVCLPSRPAFIVSLP